jgi:amino acid adenylation domain-containing protein
MTQSHTRIGPLSPDRRKLLALLLREKGVDVSPLPPIPRRSQARPPRLSFAQQRLWVIDQLESGSSFYNIPAAARLTAKLDVAALARSLNEIVRRHEVLRTTFAVCDGRPVQVIAPALICTLPVVDLCELAETRREEELRRLAIEHVQRPFDLKRSPLLRTILLRLGEQEHVLLLIMHHIIADGWSGGVFIGEMATLYEAFSQDQPSPLPELPIQYADFAEWQREWLQGEVLHTQLDYWKRQLEGGSRVLPLPTDRPRPATQTYRGARQPMEFSEALTRALGALSQAEGVTLFMTLLAALSTLLYRYTGQEDFIVGSPVANRRRAELDGLIGFFANTLALRTNLSGNPSFRDLLGRVREVAHGAYAHQDLPFEKLVEELQPERDLSRTPLFQVMVVLQNAPVPELEMPGLRLRGIDIDPGMSKFDLLLDITDEPDTLSGAFEYNTDLFDAATMIRMAEHFRNLLESIVADPDQRLGSLPLLSPAERQRLLIDWNATAHPDPEDQCVHQRVEAQVRQRPEALAVIFEDERLCYQELNRRANQVAHHLRALGVRPEARVGICMERSVEMVIGVLAILKAGGAYVPLDPNYPPERLTFMLEDAHVPVLLTQQRLVADLFEGERSKREKGDLRSSILDPHITSVCLDTIWNALACESGEDPISETTADNLAYVIYTSGSTGRPKGVAMTHRALANLIAWQLQSFRRGPGARTLQFASLSFDVSFQEIFSTWCSGGTLVLVSEARRRDPVSLRRLLNEQSVERLFVPFIALQHLAEASNPVPESLKEIITAGEPLQISRPIARFLEALPDCTLQNQYGPTESHVVTAVELTGAVSDWPPFPPIGRPIANSRIYILDANLQPVPIGVPGEVHIGGICLARGYLNRPELTAEKFIPNPFTQWRRADDGGRNQASEIHDPKSEVNLTPGARLYKTGDLARYRPDGDIEFLGRIDHQVKIRGFRIEPGEIEAALCAHAAVREAVIVTREDIQERGRRMQDDHDRSSILDPRSSIGNKHLVAYVVADPEAVTASELRQYVKSKLPEYMLPSAFVMLESLPLTPSGKVDRRALPAPDHTQRELEETFIAPRTPIEEMLAGIWANVLGVEPVGMNDNFFELGGHSLLATQLMARAQDVFQVELPLRSLFEAPTVAALAERIEAANRAGQSLPLPPMQRVPRDKELPLSFAQQRMWFLDQLAPGNAAYNLPSAFRLTGPLSLSALQQTLNEIARRHESLRTTFALVEDRPVQVMAAPAPMALPVIDLRELSPSERESEALHLAAGEAEQPFDLARGPLLRATLLWMDQQDYVALFTMHHIISDAWSMGILVDEVAALYRTLITDQPSPLPELPIQYADFAHWQRQWLQGPVLEEQLAYWRRQLGGPLPELRLPTDHPRPPIQTFRGATQILILPNALTEELKALSRRESVTLFMTLLAAFKALLYCYTGQEDIIVGSTIAGRNRAEIEGLIGFFVNPLALRTDLSGAPTFRQLLRRVREVALGAFAHQDLPFEKIVDDLGLAGGSGRSLLQVVFGFQNAPVEIPAHHGLRLSTVKGGGSTTAKFDLTLGWGETEKGLAASLEYRTDLFEAATITRMLDHVQALLEAIVADPDRRLAALPLFKETESLRPLAAQMHLQAQPTAGGVSPELQHASATTGNASTQMTDGDDLSARQARVSARQTQLSARRARLSAEKQALLQKRLRGEPQGDSESESASERSIGDASMIPEEGQ